MELNYDGGSKRNEGKGGMFNLRNFTCFHIKIVS